MSCFFDNSQSDRSEVVSRCGFVVISLMINDAEHLFMYLLTICMSSLEKNVYSAALPLFFFLVFFAISRAAPTAYGGSQGRGQIGAVATSLPHSHSHSHSNMGSKPRLGPTPQLKATATPDP